MSWQKIYQASIPLLFPLSEKKTYAQIAKQAQSLVNGAASSIFIYEKGHMKRVYTTRPELMRVIPRKDGLTMQTYRDGLSYVRNERELGKLSPVFYKLGINSDFMIPLVYENKVFGVLSVLSYKDHHATQKNLTTLKRFIPMATLAILDMQHREHLKNALQQRNLFIALASHELKTPLTSLTLYMQMLTSKNFVNKEEILKKKLLTTTQQLTYITNDLLQTNLLNQGNLHFKMERVDLKKLITTAVTGFRDVYAGNTIHIVDSASKTAVIVGDKEKLAQVVINLLNNAIKYSQDTSDITIRLREESLYFVIEVIDKGIGIKSKDLPKIFDQFYQGANKNRQGFGIGLYLIKNIIKRHKGFIEVDTTVGKGTTMRIKLAKNV